MATLRVAAEDAGNVRIAVDGVVHQFADGVLEVDDDTAESIRRQSKTLFPHLGITVASDAPADAPPAADPVGSQADGQQPAADPPVAPATAEQKPIERMNLGDLRDAAAARGIGTDGLTKAQIRELLAA